MDTNTKTSFFLTTGKEVSEQIPPQVIKAIRMCLTAGMQLRTFFFFLALMRDPHVEFDPRRTRNTQASSPGIKLPYQGKNLLCHF